MQFEREKGTLEIYSLEISGVHPKNKNKWKEYIPIIEKLMGQS